MNQFDLAKALNTFYEKEKKMVTTDNLSGWVRVFNQTGEMEMWQLERVVWPEYKLLFYKNCDNYVGKTFSDEHGDGLLSQIKELLDEIEYRRVTGDEG